MRSRWEIWTSDARGNRLQIASTSGRFGVGRSLNSLGQWYIDLPTTFDIGLVPLDNLVEFWRAPEDGALDLFAVGFIKERERWSKARRISGPDQMDILQTRIVAYYAGSAYTSKTDQYDDMMKAVVRENFGSLATDAARNLAAYNFTIEADASLAPSGTLAFSWSNVLTTLQKIAGASWEDGTELYFDLVPVIQDDQSLGFQFRTYTSQPGQDRTQDTDSPVFFGERYGNLEDGRVQELSADEVNYVYVGGRGEEADRVIVEVENTSRSGRSPWNRREGFADYTLTDDTATLTGVGNAEITEKRPRKLFRGRLLDTPAARYGVDWALGYRVTCDHDGEQFDALVKQVDFEVESGREDISARVEVEE